MHKYFNFIPFSVFFLMINCSSNKKDSNKKTNIINTVTYQKFDKENKIIDDKYFVTFIDFGVFRRYTIVKNNIDTFSVYVEKNKNGIININASQKTYLYNFNDTTINNNMFKPFVNKSSIYMGSKTYNINDRKYFVRKFYENGNKSDHDLIITYILEDFGHIIMNYYFLDCLCYYYASK